MKGKLPLSRAIPGRSEGAGDVVGKLEAMQKKLLADTKASQAAALKTLRDDMRKETKRIETATQAQARQNIVSSALPLLFTSSW